MRKIGINAIHRVSIPEPEQFSILKQVGFDCVMFNYFVGDNVYVNYDAAVKAGIEIANIHAPISTVNTVWEDGTDGDDYIEIQKERIDFCHSAGIPTMVLHTTFLKNPPPVSDIGILRHMRLCEYARNKEVRLAFENVEPYPHLDAVVKNMGDYHGFCWDVGHNSAYAPSTDFMALYGEKLVAVHIHDNFGINQDNHMLPYDGIIDWNLWADKIRNSPSDCPLTLEFAVGAKEEYTQIPFEELAQRALERADKLRRLVG